MLTWPVNEADRLSYVALGDSLTVGIGTPFMDPGFVERYLRYSEIALQKSIYLNVFARRGATTGEVLSLVKNPGVTHTIKEAEFITITAGGNDLIQAALTFLKEKDQSVFYAALDQCTENLSAILKHIHSAKAGGTPFMIRLVNLYNPLDEVEGSDIWVEKFNRHIESFAKDRHVKVADIFPLFNGNEDELLSADSIHPNAKGYEVIARAVANLGW